MSDTTLLQHDDIAIAAVAAWFAEQRGEIAYGYDFDLRGDPIGRVWERPEFRDVAVEILRAIDDERAERAALDETIQEDIIR
jgi:hypothetical protein